MKGQNAQISIVHNSKWTPLIVSISQHAVLDEQEEPLRKTLKMLQYTPRRESYWVVMLLYSIDREGSYSSTLTSQMVVTNPKRNYQDLTDIGGKDEWIKHRYWCVCFRVFICLCVPVCLCMFVYVSIFDCMFVYVSACMSVCHYVCLQGSFCACLYDSVPVYIFVCRQETVCICLSVYVCSREDPEGSKSLQWVFLTDSL